MITRRGALPSAEMMIPEAFSRLASTRALILGASAETLGSASFVLWVLSDGAKERSLRLVFHGSVVCLCRWSDQAHFRCPTWLKTVGASSETWANVSGGQNDL